MDPTPSPAVSASQTWSHYPTPPPALRRLGLTCVGTGGQHGHVAPVHERVLDHHAAVFVDNGAGWLRTTGSRTGDRRVRVEAGTMFWLYPGVRHSYGPDPAGWSERWVLFHGTATTTYAEFGLLDEGSPVTVVESADPILRLFARMRTACATTSPLSDVTLTGLIHELIVTAYRVRTTPRADEAARAVATLRRDATDRTSVAGHAAGLGLSVRRLRELVREATGSAPKDVILRERLSLAQSLLAESDLPVGRVAARVGYDDPAYFTRLFTARIGMSPATFRHRYLRG